MNDADHSGRVEGVGAKWHAVGVGGDIEIARVTEVSARILQLFQRVVEKNNLPKHVILIGNAPEAGADLQQTVTAAREKLPQDAALDDIFVIATLTFPKVLPIA